MLCLKNKKKKRKKKILCLKKNVKILEKSVLSIGNIRYEQERSRSLLNKLLYIMLEILTRARTLL
jgi:hypothetical protein